LIRRLRLVKIIHAFTDVYAPSPPRARALLHAARARVTNPWQGLLE